MAILALRANAFSHLEFTVTSRPYNYYGSFIYNIML